MNDFYQEKKPSTKISSFECRAFEKVAEFRYKTHLSSQFRIVVSPIIGLTTLEICDERSFFKEIRPSPRMPYTQKTYSL